MAKKKAKAEEIVAPEVEADAVVVADAPTEFSATIQNGALRASKFTYTDGALNVRVGANQNPVGVGQVVATVLNPHGETAQIKLAIENVQGDSIIAMPRDEANALVESLTLARANAPTQRQGVVGGLVSGFKQTVRAGTRKCKSCGG